MIPYGRQSIDDADREAVMAVLQSDWLTQGPAIERFERKVAEHCDVPYAVAVSSATAALHIGAAALGLGPGDSLWTSPNTFVASANCAPYCGARPGFVDIEIGTGNMSIEALREKLAGARKDGELPKVVVPVDFAGQPCEMAAIHELSREFGFAVMQDASHGIGSTYQGRPTGSCDHSELCVFSFHPVKIITTGEGGLITTRRRDLYEKLLRLRTHGITRDPQLLSESTHGPWYYEQIDLGWNYRMTDIHAALGCSQMDKLNAFVARRRELADRYDRLLRGLSVQPLERRPDRSSSWHLYVVRVGRTKSGHGRREVFESLRSRGIGAQVHYIPVHLQPYYRAMGFKAGDFPMAEAHYSESISLPLFASMTESEQDQVVGVLREAMSS